MATPSVPDGLSVGLDSAEVVASDNPYYVVENHDGASVEAEYNDDDLPKNKSKHVDLPQSCSI